MKTTSMHILLRVSNATHNKINQAFQLHA